MMQCRPMHAVVTAALEQSSDVLEVHRQTRVQCDTNHLHGVMERHYCPLRRSGHETICHMNIKKIKTQYMTNNRQCSGVTVTLYV